MHLGDGLNALSRDGFNTLYGLSIDAMMGYGVSTLEWCFGLVRTALTAMVNCVIPKKITINRCPPPIDAARAPSVSNAVYSCLG